MAVALSVVGNLLPDEEVPVAAATEPSPTTAASSPSPTEPEPAVEPDPVDTDGDGVADQADDFPKDERYSKDSDGDKVADSEDDFPADPSRSKITNAMYNAIDSASSYLDYTAFSRNSLIGQLEYEGFTYEQASYGANKAY